MASTPASETNDQVLEPSVPVDVQIRLRIGEYLFTTSQTTLTGESGYFASMFSGRWNEPMDDGMSFIDANGAMFQHILQYLRRRIFPLFFDATNGHNVAMYLSLLEEAKFFQIPRLEEWLEQKQYLKAAETKVSFEMLRDVCLDQLFALSQAPPANTNTTYKLYPAWGRKQVFICPRGIPVHRGAPSMCGRKCMNRAGSPAYDEEPCLHVLVAKQTVVYDLAILLARD